MTENNNNICKAHSGLCVKLDDIDENMKDLWHKYDSIQKMMLAGLVGIIANLVGIIIAIAHG